jgi:hypothetical protein
MCHDSERGKMKYEYEKISDTHHFTEGCDIVLTTEDLYNIPTIHELVKLARQGQETLERYAKVEELSIKEYHFLMKLRKALEPFDKFE